MVSTEPARRAAMLKTAGSAATYLQFVRLARALRDIPLMDAMEERILNGLAAKWAAGESVRVLEAMDLDVASSPTTVHRRLRSLREKGLVTFADDHGDSRIKYIVPTAQARAYFAKLRQVIDKVARKK
ncbi:hypothetical protein [Variovorax sp. WS11]|uniref:hypothetical protein n=2 Tax=Variovorax sp. WS11 TaxID=1105204 RepID=UPI0015E6696C|nr:hypothetical protein [Variovorax sp. WS11]